MHHFKSKKSIELSLSFIVVIIMSIVILGFGIRFMSQLFSKATDISSASEEDFDRQMANLMCEGSERVCVTPQRKAIKKDEYSVIGLKIMNIIDPPQNQPAINFEIRITAPNGPPSGLLGYNKNNQPIVRAPDFDGLIVVPDERSIDLEKYEERNLGFAVQVPKNAPSGNYILNVEVKANGASYPPVHKVYIEVP